MRDLELLSMRFMEYDIPRSKEYLLKYFNGLIQERFIVYYFVFPYDRRRKRYLENFIDHTGIFLGDRYLRILLRRIHTLEKNLRKAEEIKDHEAIATILSGRWQEPWKRIYVWHKNKNPDKEKVVKRRGKNPGEPRKPKPKE